MTVKTAKPMPESKPAPTNAAKGKTTKRLHEGRGGKKKGAAEGPK
jgi:hypothetical protein